MASKAVLLHQSSVNKISSLNICDRPRVRAFSLRGLSGSSTGNGVVQRFGNARDAKVAVAERDHGMLGGSDDDFSFDDYQIFPKDSANTKYRRVMLKLSGEALQGDLGFGVDPKVLASVARDIAECQMRGMQVRYTQQPPCVRSFLPRPTEEQHHSSQLCESADGGCSWRRQLLPWRQRLGGSGPCDC